MFINVLGGSFGFVYGMYQRPLSKGLGETQKDQGHVLDSLLPFRGSRLITCTQHPLDFEVYRSGHVGKAWGLYKDQQMHISNQTQVSFALIQNTWSIKWHFKDVCSVQTDGTGCTGSELQSGAHTRRMWALDSYSARCWGGQGKCLLIYIYSLMYCLLMSTDWCPYGLMSIVYCIMSTVC